MNSSRLVESPLGDLGILARLQQRGSLRTVGTNAGGIGGEPHSRQDRGSVSVVWAPDESSRVDHSRWPDPVESGPSRADCRQLEQRAGTMRPSDWVGVESLDVAEGRLKAAGGRSWD